MFFSSGISKLVVWAQETATLVQLASLKALNHKRGLSGAARVRDKKKPRSSLAVKDVTPARRLHIHDRLVQTSTSCTYFLLSFKSKKNKEKKTKERKKEEWVTTRVSAHLRLVRRRIYDDDGGVEGIVNPDLRIADAGVLCGTLVRGVGVAGLSAIN